ncbi:MAG: HNH endonuclease [Rhodoferax sp.]|nr:HNH endonuclease [Rhodoferax sp.]
MLSTPGYCDAHRPLAHRDYGRVRRGFDAEVGFYQSRQWRALRAAYLREHPLCCVCGGNGFLVPARVVDHVLPIKDGGARFDACNLQSLCVPCHNRKTARETGSRRRPPRGG